MTITPKKENLVTTRPCLSRLPRIAPSVLIGILLCAAGGAQAITEIHVSSPQRLTLGPDGAIWYSSPARFGRLDSSGTAETRVLPSIGPGAIASGVNENLWFITPDYKQIARMTTSGEVTAFPTPPLPPNIDPTFIESTGNALSSGPDGSLWFVEAYDYAIGRITPSGELAEFNLLTRAPVTAMAVGADGTMWFTQSIGHKIGRITPSGHVAEFTVDGGAPYAITAGPDGNLWFTKTGFHAGIGRITPSGEITEFSTSSSAYAIVAGADGNLWAASPGTLRRITPDGSMTDFSIPTVTPEFFLAPATISATPDGSIWIADHDNSRIVRFLYLESTNCVADTTSLCLDNGRFRVTTAWRTGDGSTGHGRAINLTANSGYFWFFDAANVEMIVKVLDGCEVNQHDWVFAAGLTNVEVTTTVTDTYSGLSRIYTNAQATPFAPVQDTAAFETCP